MSSEAVLKDFNLWYERLQKLAAERGWDIGTFAQRDMWRDYFSDGDSPEEALEDDIAHN